MTEARFPGSVRLVEAAAPGTPPTGMVYVYVKADGILYFKDDAGTETACGGGGGISNPLVADLDFAQFEALQFVLENRTSDPGAPVAGQMWLRTDL